MRKASRHIANFLLSSFLVGVLIAPALHQVHHGLELLADAHDVNHVHPDYDALGDDSPHLQNKELTCVLCSLSLFGDTSEPEFTSIPDTYVIIRSWDEQYGAFHETLFPIRGPPAIC